MEAEQGKLETALPELSKCNSIDGRSGQSSAGGAKSSAAGQDKHMKPQPFASIAAVRHITMHPKTHSQFRQQTYPFHCSHGKQAHVDIARKKGFEKFGRGVNHWRRCHRVGKTRDTLENRG